MNMQNNHMLMMALACAVPMLLIIGLQAYGFKGNYLVLFGMGLMVALHLGMMRWMDHNNCKK